MGGYIGAKTGTLVASASDIRGDISATDTTPEITLKNTTETDADGTRSGKITFKGEQSGGEESVLAQIQGSHDGTADDEKGDLIFKTNDGNDALAPTERLRINSAGDVLVSSPDPSLTITNTTEEDTDGGREGTIVFKGEQSGGELSTLAEIEASHDGTADDEKGDLIFKTNDGSDGASPTERLRIDSDGSIITATLGTDNVHLGENAGAAIASGGNNNVAIGKGALASNTTSDNSTAVGFEAGTNSTGAQNTFFGRKAGRGVTSGTENTFVGNSGGRDSTITGDYNIGIGSVPLNALTSGSNNIAMGREALGANTTASDNTAIGYEAAKSNTTGTDVVAVGKSALEDNTTGVGNVAIGRFALADNTTANGNVAVGGYDGSAQPALRYNTTGASNVAVGSGALAANTTASNNVAVGRKALSSNTTGSFNVAVGAQALETTTTGVRNCSFGHVSGASQTTGSDNTCIGYAAGNYSGALVTGNHNTIIGAFSSTSTTSTSLAAGLGYFLDCAGGYTTLGNQNSDIRASHGSTTWSTVSDERYKKDITDSTVGLSFINALRPRTFNYKNLGELPETFRAYEEGSTEVFKSDKTQHGFIAQEVKAAMDADSGVKDGFKLWDDREDGSQEVAEAALLPVLVKAIQELSTKNDALEAQNTTQATQIADLITRVTALEAE